MDLLSAMFSHALRSKILIGVPLGEFGSRCNLHYVDDLLALTMGGLGDFMIVELIIYLFEGMTGLETKFSKTLNCAVGLLPVTYLGVPL